jgi:hypothetical protein
MIRVTIEALISSELQRFTQAKDEHLQALIAIFKAATGSHLGQEDAHPCHYEAECKAAQVSVFSKGLVISNATSSPSWAA